MTSPQQKSQWQRALTWVVYVLATLVGLKYGYEFGNRIGGMWLAVFLALIGAAFTSILADAAIDRLLRWQASRRAQT